MDYKKMAGLASEVDANLPVEQVTNML